MAMSSSRSVQKLKTNDNTTTNKKTIDPFQKRLNQIRIYILNNTRRPKQLTFEEPTLIFDQFLYLGGLKSLKDKSRLARLNITHIVSVIGFRPNSTLIPSNIKHLYLKADDSLICNMTPYFERACQFIEEARQSNGRVLIHCACGVSRSTTICCAYLMKHHSMTIEEALIHLRKRRHIVQPNSAFLAQLINFNEEILCDNQIMNNLIEKLENV